MGINLRVLRIKRTTFLGFCFHTNTNTYRDFQICISVPLNANQSSEITFLKIKTKSPGDLLIHCIDLFLKEL